jgi:hypothetical protein
MKYTTAPPPSSTPRLSQLSGLSQVVYRTHTQNNNY